MTVSGVRAEVLKTIVILKCGELHCALDRAAVREVVPLPALSRPPSLPAIVEGVMDLNGEAILVVSLGSLMGATPDPEIDPLYHHIVVMRTGAAGMGLLVDRVENVRAVDEAETLSGAPETSVNACVVGEVDLDGRKVHLLDADRIFMSAEQVRLAEIRKAEQARLDALEAT